jgi:chromosome segregation ATPase
VVTLHWFLYLVTSFLTTPKRASFLAMPETVFASWACSGDCVGPNGKHYMCRGAMTRCPKCHKGPAPGSRKKVEKGSGKGQGGKGSGKGDKTDDDKYFTLVQKSLKGIQEAMHKQEKRIDEVLGKGTSTATAAPPAATANPVLDSLKAKLKELQQHLDHAKDEHLIEFLRPKIEEVTSKIKEEQDRTTSASEQTYNLAGDTLKDFQATRTKVQKLGPAIKKIKDEVEVLAAKKDEIEKLMADKMTEEGNLAKELEAAECKLEKFAKAALSTAQEPVMPAVAPTDINLLIKGAQQLTVAAEAQLSKEGAVEFKKIMSALTDFNSKLPTFFATNLGVPDDEDMEEEDTYLDEELEEASKVAEAAALGAAPNAKVERVRCHAYTTKLNSLKRARVMKAKKEGQLG